MVNDRSSKTKQMQIVITFNYEIEFICSLPHRTPSPGFFIMSESWAGAAQLSSALPAEVMQKSSVLQ